METFVEELAQRMDAQHAPVVEGVTLATLHAAKGLEWDAVFLVGLVDGTLPITHATTPEQVGEERRLLYVGMTRARRHLSLSWAQARAAGGRRSRKPSRFLDGLRPGARDLHVRGVAGARQGHLVLPRGARRHVLVRPRPPHHPHVRLDAVPLEPAAIAHPVVGLGMQVVRVVQARGVAIEGVGVLHDELAGPQEAGAGPRLVALLDLEVVEDLREVAIRALVLHRV